LSGEREQEADADPDEKQRREDPEQEGGLADGKPRDLRATEEEPRPPETTAVSVELGDLAAHRVRWILSHTAVGVEVYDGLASRTIPLSFDRHGNSVALVLGAALGHDDERRVPQRSGRVR
jgi:hypothetical protein